MVRRHEARQKYLLKRGEMRMTQAALGEIGRMEQQHAAPRAVLGDFHRGTLSAEAYDASR